MFSAAGACFRARYEGCRMLIFDGSGEQETLREYCELSEKYAGVHGQALVAQGHCSKRIKK